MEKFFREVKQKMIFRASEKLDFPAHIHDDIELVFVQSGGGVAYCDGVRYTLEKNAFFLVFPNQVHRYAECIDSRYIVLIVKPSQLLLLEQVFEQGAPVSALWRMEAGCEDIATLLQMAKKEFEETGDSIVVAAYLTALFGKLLAHYQLKKDTLTHNTVLQVLHYCTAHYREEISVGSVAAQLGLSKSSVSHIFSTRLSMHFCNYINSLRLEDAVQLLKNKNYSVTDVASRCGFPTLRTFNRAFLKQYGISPSAYRKGF